MKPIKRFIAVVMLVLLIGSIAITSYTLLNRETKQFYEGFYVGVTYCGSSVQEAKELIDKVKDYTNLFILQSGTITNSTDVHEIGDHAIASKLKFAVYNGASIFYDFGSNAINVDDQNKWANAAKERWGEHFIGIYYEDEPGGKMLDGYVDNLANNGVTWAYKNPESITVVNDHGHFVYYRNGEVTTSFYGDITYHPNGTIEISENNNMHTIVNSTEYTAQILSYEQILKQNPIQNNDDAARAFINYNKGKNERINKTQLNEADILVFTADYGLYWWDFQSGYDIVLAELGWNNSITQEIALVRGAANLQNKQWGTIITWKYDQEPFLADGNEIYEQMKTSYEAGAEYVIIFNYSEHITDPNTLQEEHFQALERFWKDVVQNPEVTHGGIKAEVVLVLPQNYGWGMRHPDDHLWGIWQPDDISQQIWSQLQNKIDKHGLKLDIIFEEPNYPVTGRYSYIYYWDQKQ